MPVRTARDTPCLGGKLGVAKALGHALVVRHQHALDHRSRLDGATPVDGSTMKRALSDAPVNRKGATELGGLPWPRRCASGPR